MPKAKLPTKKSKPVGELGQLSTLLYGEEKIGKTDLASNFPNAIFFMFEAGAKDHSIYQVPMTSWQAFKDYIVLLETEEHQFQTAVIDTADIAFQLCLKHVCKQMGVEHPSDEDWGKGWQTLRNELLDTVIRFGNCGMGSVFISHVTEREIKQRNGLKSDKIVPTLSGQARDVLYGHVDLIAYYTFDQDDNRILQVKGDSLVTAGTRLKNHFVGVKTIPMGTSSEEGYFNFVKAFNEGGVNGKIERKANKKVIRKKKVPAKRRK